MNDLAVDSWSLQARVALSREVERHGNAVADEVTAAFFRAHPEWIDRYGELGRVRCSEDVRYLVTFLAAAIAAGAPEGIADYVRWSRVVLESRGIDVAHVSESLTGTAEALRMRLSSEGGALVDQLLERCLEALKVPMAPAPVITPAAEPFLAAILASDREQAAAVLERALVEGGRRHVYKDVVQPSLREVGRMWQLNRISVAEEHIATACAQHVIARFAPAPPRREANAGRALLAGVAGEQHQVGLTLLSDYLEGEGVEVRYVGTNVPRRALLALVASYRPDVIGLSVTLLSHLDELRETVAAIRSQAGAGPRVIGGGAALRHCADFATAIGLDGTATDFDAGASLLLEGLGAT